MNDQTITLDELFQVAVNTLRDEGESIAKPHLDLIAQACGTTVDAELERFRSAAAGDHAVAEELLDDLRTMCALMQYQPPVAKEYDFTIPEASPHTSGLELPPAGLPSDLLGLFR